jgi:hypothetical protein
MGVIVFDKRTSEKLDYTFDFTESLDAIGGGTVIDGSPTVTVTPNTLTTVSTSVVTGNKKIACVFSGGADQVEYLITCTVNLTGAPDRDLTQQFYLKVLDYPATDTNNLYVSVATLAQKLGVTAGEDQIFLIDCARQATSLVKSITGRIFERETGIVEKVAGTGRKWLMLGRFPVQSITSIVYDGATVDASTYELYDARSGIVYTQDGWKNALANEGKRYTVTYSAGYITPGKASSDFPYEVSLAAFEIAKGVYNMRLRDGSVQSEEVPNVYKVSYGVNSGSVNQFSAETLITPNILRLLRPYMAVKL